jgi:hypothetical protein
MHRFALSQENVTKRFRAEKQNLHRLGRFRPHFLKRTNESRFKKKKKKKTSKAGSKKKIEKNRGIWQHTDNPLVCFVVVVFISYIEAKDLLVYSYRLNRLNRLNGGESSK